MSKSAPHRSVSSALRSESTLPDPLDRSALVQELRDAIHHDELFVCYQPKYRPRSGRIDAVEALVRWQHPINGIVAPGEFIGVAEENGLIQDLSRWVTTRVLLDREKLQQDGHDVSIHINLSSSLVGDEGFALWMAEAVRGLEPGALGLEITASALLSEPEAALRNLNTMAEAGLALTVDDFGKGAWSLSTLTQMPAREFKIDRSLIAVLTTRPGAPRLVRACIELAHALDMQVTAMGVESEALLHLLQTMGCDLIQGFVISPAIEIVDLQDFLAAGPAFQDLPMDLMRTSR